MKAKNLPGGIDQGFWLFKINIGYSQVRNCTHSTDKFTIQLVMLLPKAYVILKGATRVRGIKHFLIAVNLMAVNLNSRCIN